MLWAGATWCWCVPGIEPLILWINWPLVVFLVILCTFCSMSIVFKTPKSTHLSHSRISSVNIPSNLLTFSHCLCMGFWFEPATLPCLASSSSRCTLSVMFCVISWNRWRRFSAVIVWICSIWSWFISTDITGDQKTVKTTNPGTLANVGIKVWCSLNSPTELAVGIITLYGISVHGYEDGKRNLFSK